MSKKFLTKQDVVKEVTNTSKFSVSDPLILNPLQVFVRNPKDPDSVASAAKYFRFLVQKEGILVKHKEKSRYEKPSQKKKRKRNEARLARLEAEVRERKMLSGELEREKEAKEKKRQEKIKKLQELRSNDTERYNFL